jgi:hypothetical protein
VDTSDTLHKFNIRLSKNKKKKLKKKINLSNQFKIIGFFRSAALFNTMENHKRILAADPHHLERIEQFTNFAISSEK